MKLGMKGFGIKLRIWMFLFSMFMAAKNSKRRVKKMNTKKPSSPKVEESLGEEMYSAVTSSEVPGNKDCYFADERDTNPVGVRYSPDGNDRYWFDKVKVMFEGKEIGVYRLDRKASKPE